MRHRRAVPVFVAVGFAVALLFVAIGLSAEGPADHGLVPAAIRDPILNETSGEQAYLHAQILAANRDRQAAEYQDQFFETTYIRDMARQYGLSDVQVDFFPTRDTWDAEEGDLWLVQPSQKKLASITMVPTALAQGSRNADVETDVVFVGQGREADYAGKDVKGKVVMGMASAGNLFNVATTHGAVGVLGISASNDGYGLDQIGWSSVAATADRNGFGFGLSMRQFLELRTLLDRGDKVVVRVHVRSKTYPGKMNVISAAIPGTNPAAGELILVAHAFETIATPGANDNCTGVGTILEVARTLSRLIRDKTLAPPTRTIRFLWVPELSGSRAFMFKHPELQDRLIAALNFDMTGADTALTGSYLRMKMTPDSRPSFLNDLMANLLQVADQTKIRAQQGRDTAFNYRLSPVAAITSGSDHSVFNDGGVPAMQFNYWPDNFYHSSGDRIVNVDPTELKRVGFVAASAMYYMAAAGAPQARDLAWESATNGEKWIADVTRQSAKLIGSDSAALPAQHKAAQTKVTAAFNRTRGNVESVLALAKGDDVAAAVKRSVAVLETARDANAKLIDALVSDRAAAAGSKFVPAGLTDKEREYALLVPKRLFKTYSPDAQQRQGQGGGRAGGGRGAGGVGEAGAAPRRLPGSASSEVTNFIDGTRSVLDIYNAVSAECGNLVTGRDETKFGYVLSPDAPDVDIELVYAAIMALQKDGTVEIVKVAPKTAAPKTGTVRK